MEAFKNVLNDCELADLGFWGPKFTWSNCKWDGVFTKERLDRVMANRMWCMRFHAVGVVVESTLHSDHLPIFLFLHKRKVAEGARRGRFFCTLAGICTRIVRK
jgi:endonuclease/exonuclease/phosphatase family metal-dependent hydrolase